VTQWRLEWSERAKDDLWEIWNHVAAEDRKAADRLVAALTAAFTKIADFPRLGHLAEGLGEEYRVLTIRKYLLLYRLQPETRTVLLVRAVHGARDIPALFSEGR
jgi:toxin ParE1/3/4